MKISVVIPTYNRPHQLVEALDSLAMQDCSVIDEVLLGDNSSPEMRDANAAIVAASPIASLIRHHPNVPPTNVRENQKALARRARSDYFLILHDDDHLLPGALAKLTAACVAERDPRVKVWFGRNYVMNQDGVVDTAGAAELDRTYGKDGPEDVRPVWRWCLTQSLPPNSALIDRAAYLAHMEDDRDGNVSDWGFWVRLANSGAWGRFIPEYIWTYRVQQVSESISGRGMDAHHWYEICTQLAVPPEYEGQKKALLEGVAVVATTRYIRDGERRRAWDCLASPYWRWRDRLSLRGLATYAMLVTPRPLWLWALRFRG